MTQKITLVTGATDGIGYATSLLLAQRGHHVLVHGRAQQKAQETVERLQKEHAKGRFTAVAGDLSSAAGARALAAQVTTVATEGLDVLLNNAGVFMKELRVSPDGLELTFQVNHLSHMALTHALLPVLRRKPGARVVNVSSVAHNRGRLDLENLRGEKGFDGYTAYAMSKLCNVLFTTEFARRVKPSEISAYALHPGVIATKLLKTGFGGGGNRDISTGAATSVWLATGDDVAGVSGRYYSDEQEVEMAPQAADARAAKALWEKSCELLQIQWP